MATEKDDVLKANQGAPAADIPDLKKKEKERKKGGAAWSGANGGAGSFAGATGGTVARAAASAAIGAAEAGETGGLLATISEFLTGLTATLAGKLAVGAAAFLMMMGAGALAYSLLHGGANAGAGGMGRPDLGGIASSLHVRSGDGDMMGVNGKGELAFGASKAPAAPTDATAGAKADDKAAPKADDKSAPNPADAQPYVRQDVLAHNLSGSKLSSSLGGDFGGKNIFAGGNSGYAPKFNAGLSQLSGMGGKPGVKGNLGSMAVKSTRSSIAGMQMQRARSNQAIGQLKMARGMSTVGASAPTAEGAAAAANGAFDQQNPTGGDLNTIGGAGLGSGPTNGASSGSGAPDTTSMPNAPGTPPGAITDPGLQNNMNQIQSMAQQAGQLQKEGMMMIVAGVALIAVGIALMNTLWGAALGAALIGIGGMLVGMGFMMEQMASMMAQMANQLGSLVASQVGPYQGQIVQQCTAQSLQGNSNCTPAETTAIQQQVSGTTSAGDPGGSNGAALKQQSTIGTATPVLSNSGVNVQGGPVAGSGGAKQ